MFFGELAALHAFGKPDLFLHREKIGFADLLQVEADRVANARGDVLRVCRAFLRVGLADAIRGRRDWLGGCLVKHLDAFGHQGRVEFVEAIEMLFSVGEGGDNLV